MDESRLGLLAESEARASAESRRSDADSDLDVTDFLQPDPLTATTTTTKTKTTKTLHTLLQWPRRLRLPRPRLLLMIVAVLLALAAGLALAWRRIVRAPVYGQSPPWYPSPRGGTAAAWAMSYTRAADLVRRMTLAEKVNVTTGTGWSMGPAVGNSGPASLVGFPALRLQDGPLGIRYADHATALPAGITVGATWNTALMWTHGAAHGREARGKGLHVLLGPCVGPLGRLPAGGRNWEGFGADPYLQGVAGAATVRGIQEQGVMATIKHFVGNEQEHFRQPWEWGLPNALSATIDDRALHELYAWPFGDAVRAGVASVMCSYNMVNSSYACSNSKLLNGILKDELGFQGFVMSDWLAQRAGVASALAGLDMTMPGDGLRWMNGDSLWGGELSRAVLNGSVPVSRLNDMATRIVAAYFQLGQDAPDFFDGDVPNFSSWTDDATGLPHPGSPSPQTPEVVNHFVDVQANHSALARQIAAEGIVLLKNTDDFLPLHVDGQSAAQGVAGAAARVAILGEDAGAGRGPNACADRGCNQGTLASGWGSGSVEFPYLVTPADALAAALDDAVDLQLHLTNAPPTPAALADRDLCLVFVNADAGEGYISSGGIAGDRNDLDLQNGGDALVEAAASSCGHVVVVLHAVGPVVVEQWIDLPAVVAVLHAHLPGQESGNALVDVLLGRVNPSGHLPYTIGRSLADYGAAAQILVRPNAVVPQQVLDSDIDYRYFDRMGLAPRFAFGYGLSYTTFALDNLTVVPRRSKSALPAARPAAAVQPPDYDTAIPDRREALFPAGFRRLSKYVYPYLDSVADKDLGTGTYPYPAGYDDTPPLSGAGGDEGGNPDLWETYVTVTVNVHNTGARAGQAVVQLYMAYPEQAADAAGVVFPVKVLRGFAKVALDVDETQTATFDLTRRDLSYWDVGRQNWVLVTGGAYRLLVGQSAGDLPVEGTW